jgi:hypothetical protein
MKKIFFASFVSLVLIGGAVAYAQAQESNIPQGPTDAQVQASGITFPVAELGNCADKQACKQYCENPANVEACVAFAEKHGLMNKDEAARAKKFTKALEKGGPGGCRSPRECEAFCSDINNLEVCMKFAKDQGVKGKQIEQGEKVLKHIKAGGKTPGGCRSENDCRAYCSDFSHAEECFEFAKAAGIVQVKGDVARPGGRPGGPPGDDDIPSPEQFQKLMELSKSGQTPGGCTSKDACEAYCEIPGHIEECVAFAEKVGFMSKEEAAMVRKAGGKGPGGCSSPRECEAFCNNPANRETCFKFAEEHGLISEEDKRRMQEGLVQMRAGIEHAPPEVAACLKSTVGPNIIDDIQSGKFMPGPEIGDRMRDCFEKFGHREGPQDIFQNAPPEVMACLKEKIGSKFEAIKAGKEMPTPEMADAFRVCFQSVQFERQFTGEGEFGGPGGPRGEGPQGQRGPGVMMGRPPAQAIQQFVRTAPPQIQECLQQKLGDNFAKLQSGGSVDGFDPSVMKSCFESFRPQEHFGPPPGGEGGMPAGARLPGGHGFGPPGQGGFPGRPGGISQGGLPQEVVACVKSKVGDVSEEKLSAGSAQGGELGQAIKECFMRINESGHGQDFFGSGREGKPEEYFGTPGGPQGQGGGFEQGFGPGFGPGGIPREILSCVREKVGEEVSEEKLRATKGVQGNLGQAIQECFGRMQLPGKERQGEQEGGRQDQRFGPPGIPGPGGLRGGGGRSPAPEPVLQCVKEKLSGAVDLEGLRRGDQPSPEVEKVMGECFSKVSPQPQGRQGEGERGSAPPFPGREGFSTGTVPTGQFQGQPSFPKQFDDQANRQYSAEFEKQYQERFKEEFNRQTQGQGPQGGFPFGGGQPGGPGLQQGLGGEQHPQPGSTGGQGGFPGGLVPGGAGSLPQGGGVPLGGFGPGFVPPPGGFTPPSGGTPPPFGDQQAPPGGVPSMPTPTFTPPPPPPPSSAVPRQSLLGIILAPFIELLGIGR